MRTYADEEVVEDEKLTIGKGSALDHGGCNACTTRAERTVIIVNIRSMIVRFCPSCARKLRESLGKALRS